MVLFVNAISTLYVCVSQELSDVCLFRMDIIEFKVLLRRKNICFKMKTPVLIMKHLQRWKDSFAHFSK